jgi:hypothetical protein
MGDNFLDLTSMKKYRIIIEVEAEDEIEARIKATDKLMESKGHVIELEK